MRQVLGFALAGWLIIAMTMAQACAGPALSTPPYAAAGTASTQGSNQNGSFGSGSSEATNPGETNNHVDTTGYTPDRTRSDALSSYLKQKKLPLVGAQVLRNPAGQRMVVLYGFVGSDFGRSDAVAKTRKYLGDSSITVDNRIKVRPELLAAGNAGSGGSATGEPDTTAGTGSSLPGISSYENQQNEAQQYVQQQNSGAAMSSMAPLLMLGLMALSFSSGGGMAVGPGSFGSFGSFGSPGLSPFGPPSVPYNPYPGYPSPAPYSGSPFGP